MAQTALPQAGDPPVVERLRIGAADADGQVTVSGVAGAVFPGARVAVRNLYTQETVYGSANINGAFSVRLFGPGNTPFWVSPLPVLPADAAPYGGPVLGGPGTLIAGPLPDAPVVEDDVTALRIDGALDDWALYPQAALGAGFYTLRNLDSLYLAVAAPPPDYATLRLTVRVGTGSATLSLDPRRDAPATLRVVAPVRGNDTPVVVAAAQQQAVELRVPLASLEAAGADVRLVALEYLGADGAILVALALGDAPVPRVDERDGVVLEGAAARTAVAFTVSGTVNRGAARWHATGTAPTQNLDDGRVRFALDVLLAAPALPPDAADVALFARVALLPLAVPGDAFAPGTPTTANGWSTVTTRAGLPLAGVDATVPLGEVAVPTAQVLRQGGALRFALVVDLAVPPDLPPGRYVPVVTGVVQAGQGAAVPWARAEVLARPAEGASLATSPDDVRLPLVLIGGEAATAATLLPAVLFYDVPTETGRGLLLAPPGVVAALGTRTQHDAPQRVLPPGVYAVEPTLLSLLPNMPTNATAPLIPLASPVGTLSGQVIRPDATTDALPTVTVAQVRVSSAALDDRERFGPTTPQHGARLETLDPRWQAYPLTDYGTYTLSVSADVRDVWGQRYSSGGTAEVLIAEPLDLSPGLLPGAPLGVDQAVSSGLRVSPAVAAEVSLVARLFPLDGSPPQEQRLRGTANAYGVFQPVEPLRFDAPGEYVLDYEARFTDSVGRLWAGSVRAAGVVVGGGPGLALRGVRGVPPVVGEAAARAWGATEAGAAVGVPYFQGDVLALPTVRGAGLLPLLSVQDRAGAYPLALLDAAAADAQAALERAWADDALPHDARAGAYALFSAVRPDVVMRQFALGGSALPTAQSVWLLSDGLAGQVGGGGGQRPSDWALLYGGNVVGGRAAGWAALAVMEEAPRGALARVFPAGRGADGAQDAGPLLTLGGNAYDAFFVPTGVRPGEVLFTGDVLSVAGHVAPPNAASVTLEVTAPSGRLTQATLRADAWGYAYDPALDVAVQEPGVWTVRVRVALDGPTSAGLPVPPVPTGVALGTVAREGQFSVIVLPSGTPALGWSDTRPDLPAPTGLPLNITVPVPDGWTNVTGRIVQRVPAFVIRDEMVPVTAGALRVTINTTLLARAYPNLEWADARVTGPFASDPLTITMVLAGVGVDGQPRIGVRQLLLRHDRYYAIDGVLP